MEAKRLSFSVDTKSIDIKPFLKKDFLELSMRIISDANPNENGSYFTLSSMEKAKKEGNFFNKPILGFFSDGDFVSHDGQWKEDNDTGLAYWDTISKQGERPLGLIREKDKVEIVEENGLHWVTITCVLWVQYCFKQAKRLLQDAIKAKENNDTQAKSVSVEVDITDYEKLSNGVIQINSFDLIGITILGSRHGVPVAPGIKGAGLSVTDIVGRENYERQVEGLRMAYEKLDNAPEEINKEANMTKQKVETPVEDKEQKQFAEQDQLCNNEQVHKEENEQECNKPASNCKEEKQCKMDEDDKDENKSQNPDGEENKDKPEGDDTSDDNKDDEGQDDDDKDAKQPENNEQQSLEDLEVLEDGEEHKASTSDVLYDLNWLLSENLWRIDSLTCSIEYYKKNIENIPNADIFIDFLEREVAHRSASIEECGKLISLAADDLASEEYRKQEERLASYGDVNELIDKYEKLTADFEAVSKERDEAKAELDSKVKEYEHKEFMKSVENYLSKISGITAEDIKQFSAECDSGKITSLDHLEKEVALAFFKNNNHSKSEDNSQAKEIFSGDVYKPSFPSTDEKVDDKGNKAGQSTNRWERLKNNVKR